jgi:hypothetical protein
MSRGGKARQSSLQLDMFHNADALVGVEINQPRHCPCGHDILHVGPGRGPHRAFNGKASTNASALVIETAITDNAQPFNQPWPPTGLGDGWHAVDKFSTRQRTFWRRIRLKHTRPSPRASPIHR